VRGILASELRELTSPWRGKLYVKPRDIDTGMYGDMSAITYGIVALCSSRSNASALRADRAAFVARLRALTAPAPSAFLRIDVMADLPWLTLTPTFCGRILRISRWCRDDTGSALPSAGRAVSVTSP
jgi:hypothetical protein